MKTEVKTSLEGLEVGMYVSRLDRPWIKTPFALQGMLIKSKYDIEELRKYCNYVYVDLEKGDSPDARYWVLSVGREADAQNESVLTRSEDTQVTVSPSKEYEKLRRETYQVTSEFNKELESAKVVYEKVGDDLQHMLNDLEKGRDVDVAAVQQGVSDMTESIIRNPSAMLWLLSLKKLDDYSYLHSLAVSVWCATFGRHLGFEKETIETIALGGMLLDVGKSRLPKSLLIDTEKLNDEQFKQMQTHVDLGVKLLAKAKQDASGKKLPLEVLQMVATHHERADGSGYPQGLMNDEIPLFGRIAGIVDSYDAMNQDRPYTDLAPRSPHEAINELYEMRGKQFQVELVEQFIQSVGLYPTGSLVELNTGEVGAVVAVNGLRRLRPSIMLVLDEDKNPLHTFDHIDLSQMGDNVFVKHGLPAGAFGIDMKELFL